VHIIQERARLDQNSALHVHVVYACRATRDGGASASRRGNRVSEDQGESGNSPSRSAVYTLGEAAKATGRSKAAISQALASGRLSASKDDFGRWRIVPAELFRVYPPIDPEPNGAAHPPNGDLRAENERLKIENAALERLVRRIEGEVDNLREQNTRLTATYSSVSTRSRRRAIRCKRRSRLSRRVFSAARST
jgi:hypothetical protein